ncbi:glutamine--fructose-6-phosphate transaminase (isomerizing) [Deltaproteobacteria bacterium TL4]
MCGISGIVGSQDVARTLFSSIRNLEYRGYDSCGLALINNNQISIKKNVGGVDEVNAKEQLTSLKGSIGIAHTRWATHGGVTKENAHPHLSQGGKFVIVHNGIFSNYQELKSTLIKQGIVFKSLTDTEVFVHLVEIEYNLCNNIELAFLNTLEKVDGSFAIAMLSTLDPDSIYCVKKDSPLIIGLGEGCNFVGSDINAFLQYTRNAIILDDDEYAILTNKSFVVKSTKTKKVVNKEHLSIDWDPETSKKGGYEHYMLKEIFDEPQTVKHALKVPSKDIRKLVDMIIKAETTFLVGVGTTYYVSLAGQYFFSEFAQCFLPTISSDEFVETSNIGSNDLLLTISQSGETYDTKMAVNYAKVLKAQTSAIVNVMGSSISMLVDHVIMQGSGPEICVVSTKAALAQIVIIMRTAIELAYTQNKISTEVYNSYNSDMHSLPKLIQLTLNEQSGFIRNLARATVKVKNWLFLGCGVYYPIAMESALKMKEVTYHHAEGMAAGFLKHGTLAMVEDSLYSLFFIPLQEQKSLYTRTLVAIEEVRARGGKVVGFLHQDNNNITHLLDHYILLPKVSPILAPLLQMVIAQLFSYYVALELGRNIDKPRNLAKSVTVA